MVEQDGFHGSQKLEVMDFVLKNENVALLSGKGCLFIHPDGVASPRVPGCAPLILRSLKLTLGNTYSYRRKCKTRHADNAASGDERALLPTCSLIQLFNTFRSEGPFPCL
jgi:hypothetical protein